MWLTMSASEKRSPVLGLGVTERAEQVPGRYRRAWPATAVRQYSSSSLRPRDRDASRRRERQHGSPLGPPTTASTNAWLTRSASATELLADEDLGRDVEGQLLGGPVEVEIVAGAQPSSPRRSPGSSPRGS